MKQLILVGNQKVKFQDTETTISLTLVSDGNTVTIDKNKTYSVKIKNGTGYVKSLDATPNTTNNMVTFSTSGFDGLPVDAYFIELWVIDTNGQTIYPSDSFIELDITANATGVEGQVLPAITMQEFEERFSTLQSNLETKVGTLIGPTGNGISTVVTEYQLSASGINVPTGTWSKSPVPQTDDLPYLWARTTTTYTDKSTHVSYNISAKGTKGNNFTIQGSTSSTSGLPSTGIDGEGYMVGTELYVWTNGKWNDIVNMKGDKGDQGIQGIQGFKGDTGNGISSTTTDYQLSSSGSNVPTGTWSKSPVTPTDTLPYMWTRNVTTYTDKSTHVSYNISAKGTKGNNFTIQGSTSSIAGLPNIGTDGEGYMVGTELYVWTNGKWNDIVNMKGVQGDQGIQGIQGIKGDTGNGIKSTSTDYQLSSQGVEVPNTGWSTTIPVTTNALPYLWTRVTITFTDGSQHVIYFTSNKGDKGDKGDTGEKGDTGANLAVKGALDKSTSLPSTGNSEGDAYLVGTDLYVYTKGAWKDCGPIVAENTVLYNADGSLNVNGTNFNYVQDLRNGKIQYNDGTKNVQVTPMDANKEASDILSARNYTDTSVSALSNSVDTKLSTKANTADLNTGLATKVTDNKDNTIQVNGTQVSPYNKLTDTVGGRNLYLNSKAIADGYGSLGTGITVTVEAFDSNTNMWHIVAKQGSGELVGLYLYGYANDKMPSTSDWSYSADVKGTGNIQKFGIEAGNRKPIVGTIGSEWSRISQTGHFDSAKVKTIVMYFDTTNNPVDVYIKLPKLELGSIPTDWTPAPEDKVNIADMRKPASDVAGIEEVNAKQDKLTITPADDSKVVHDNKDNTIQVNGTQVSPYNKLTDTIGGRNLLTGTGNHTVTGATAQGYLSNETTDDLLTLFKGLEGQTVTVSVDYEYSGFIAGSNRNRIGWEISIIADAASHFGPWCYPMTPNNSGSGRISSTFVVPKNITGIDESMGYIQFSGSGTGTLSHLKLEKGSVATDWCPNPEDKVNVADMRKPASDVAGIEEVNAKQDKLTITPADDSKVVHSTITRLNSTNMNNVKTAGFYVLNSGTNGIPNADAWTIYQVIPLSFQNGVQVAYGTNSAILGIRSWNGTINFTSWVQFADDSKVVHSTDMRTPASDVAGIEEVNAKQDKIGYTPADDSKVAHLSGANNFDTVPTVNNTPLLTSDKLPDNIVKQGDAIGNINYVMYLASYPTTVGQLAVADGTVDSTKTKFITTAKVYPIPTNITSMIWETPQINMPLLVGNVIAFYDTSGKFISANAYDATTSYQLINIPKNAYSFKISCGSNSLNSVKLFSGSSYIDSSPYPIVMGVRIKDKMAATTDDVTNAINTATANSADVSKANTFSKQQTFSTNPTNGTQVYPIYATVGTDADATTLIASLQSSGFSGMVGVPES